MAGMRFGGWPDDTLLPESGDGVYRTSPMQMLCPYCGIDMSERRRWVTARHQQEIVTCDSRKCTAHARCDLGGLL